MTPYQQQYAPQYQQHFVRQQFLSQTPAPMAPVQVASPDTSVKKTVGTIVTLGVTSAAAWVGINQGLKKGGGKTLKVAGWVGGVGAAVLGLATLVNLVSPPSAKTLLVPFQLPQA